jgi:hypothetical protein
MTIQAADPQKPAFFSKSQERIALIEFLSKLNGEFRA